MKFLYPGKIADDREKGVEAEAVEAGHEEDRRGLVRVEGGRVDRTGRRYAHEDLVELADARLHSLVMTLDEIADPYGSRSDERVTQPPSPEFLIYGDGENGHAQGETRKVDGQVLLPLLLPLPVPDEKTRHAELGEGKGQENVDRVHDDEGGDGAVGIDEEEQRQPLP